MRRRPDAGAVISKLLIIALMLDAAWVTVLQIGTKAWPPIIAYWAVLAVKNFVDWVRTRK